MRPGKCFSDTCWGYNRWHLNKFQWFYGNLYVFPCLHFFWVDRVNTEWWFEGILRGDDIVDDIIFEFLCFIWIVGKSVESFFLWSENCDFIVQLKGVSRLLIPQSITLFECLNDAASPTQFPKVFSTILKPINFVLVLKFHKISNFKPHKNFIAPLIGHKSSFLLI